MGDSMIDALDYKGKVCVVTGGADGPSKVIVEKLVALGAEVYALDIYECKVPGIKGYITCDLANSMDIDNAFNYLPKNIDAFFGVSELSGVKSGYVSTFNYNFMANKYIIEKFLRWRMPAGGAICLLGSTVGLNWQSYKAEQDLFVHAKSWDETANKLRELSEISPSYFAYVFSKRCLLQLVSEKVLEFGQVGIRINTVVQGFTNAGLLNEFYDLLGGQAEIFKNSKIDYKIARPENIADPCLFLNSPRAGFIVGAELPVDYGNYALSRIGEFKIFGNLPATKKKVQLNEKRRIEKLNK